MRPSLAQQRDQRCKIDWIEGGWQLSSADFIVGTLDPEVLDRSARL
jgi:hypothetical protein